MLLLADARRLDFDPDKKPGILVQVDARRPVNIKHSSPGKSRFSLTLQRVASTGKGKLHHSHGIVLPWPCSPATPLEKYLPVSRRSCSNERCKDAGRFSEIFAASTSLQKSQKIE